MVRDNGMAIGAVIAAGVVGAIVALIVALTQETRYVATTAVSLRPRAADVDAAEAADRIGANLAAWIESESFRGKARRQRIRRPFVAANLGETPTPGRSRRRCGCYWSSRTHNRTGAASVANGLARVLVEEGARSLRDAPNELALDIEQMDPARAPTAPSQPRPEIAAAIGAVLGLALSAMIAALLGWLSQPYARNEPISKTEAGDLN